ERQLDALAKQGAPVNAAPVDRETEQRLRSLGYVVAPVARRARPSTPLDDPKSLIGLQSQLDTALDALRRGDVDGAEQTLKRSIAQRPDFTIAHERLAFLYRETGRLPAAIETLESASRTTGPDAALMSTLGGYLQEANQLDRSAAVLEAAVRVN